MDEHEVYILILCAGGLLAALYFDVRYNIVEKVTRSRKIYGVLAVSLLLSIVITNGLTYFLYGGKPYFERIVQPEYYLTMVVFAVISTALIRVTKTDKTGQAGAIICDSLIIFSFISRCGCMYAGCCTGRVIGAANFPIVETEFVFAAVIFVILRLIPSRNRLGAYVLMYSIFRLITEFFRDNIGVETLLILNFRQYIAITAIVIAAVYLLVTAKKQRNNTQSVSGEQREAVL